MSRNLQSFDREYFEARKPARPVYKPVQLTEQELRERERRIKELAKSKVPAARVCPACGCHSGHDEDCVKR